MHVFDGKNWISFLSCLYFRVLPFLMFSFPSVCSQCLVGLTSKKLLFRDAPCLLNPGRRQNAQFKTDSGVILFFFAQFQGMNTWVVAQARIQDFGQGGQRSFDPRGEGPEHTICSNFEFSLKIASKLHDFEKKPLVGKEGRACPGSAGVGVCIFGCLLAGFTIGESEKKTICNLESGIFITSNFAQRIFSEMSFLASVPWCKMFFSFLLSGLKFQVFGNEVKFSDFEKENHLKRTIQLHLKWKFHLHVSCFPFDHREEICIFKKTWFACQGRILNILISHWFCFCFAYFSKGDLKTKPL